METVNYVRLSVAVHNPTGSYADPEKFRKEIETHTRIRIDPDYESDVEVLIEETA